MADEIVMSTGHEQPAGHAPFVAAGGPVRMDAISAAARAEQGHRGDPGEMA